MQRGGQSHALLSDVLVTLESANYLLYADAYVGKFLHLEMIISVL